MTIEAEDILASRVFTENMPDDEQQLDLSGEPVDLMTLTRQHKSQPGIVTVL